ncbi:MAG: isocitrate/isopropylmalate family dehydrogenase, partial [Proteobacteria bacterium]|nr:isocitrate/isopropylmalate family dehydrogenase [Pseudomonadota bacterium]
ESVKQVFKALNAPIEWDVVECGLAAFEKTGQLLPQEFTDSFTRNGVALKGPTTTPSGGGHRSINVQMRQMFNLYANIRPIRNFPGLPSHYTGIDMIIVRENSEDLYKGIEYMISAGVAQGIKLITAEASERIGRHAFELARRLNRKQVLVVHKANIMKYTDGLFLDSIRKVSLDYPEIGFGDMIVDNCCMQMVTRPTQFDVIVTENLYGDILSDLGAGLIGGLGLASGANIGDHHAIFEAVHGSAPDIAGQDKANPTALLLSAASMLDYTGYFSLGEKIRNSITHTLAQPAQRTKDLGGSLGTKSFTACVIANLEK